MATIKTNKSTNTYKITHTVTYLLQATSAQEAAMASAVGFGCWYPPGYKQATVQSDIEELSD